MSRFLAAVDLGTNSFHLVIVKETKTGFKIIERKKEVIRLTALSSGPEKKISHPETEKAIRTLLDFKKLIDSYKAQTRLIATSAIRESTNKDYFVKEVFDKTGMCVEVISGHEEAELIFLGIKKAVNIKKKRVLCFDIGGGSTELIYAENSKIKYVESYKIGAVRLSKMFFPDYLITEQQANECSEYIKNILDINPLQPVNEEFDMVVGASGTFLSFANFVNYNKTRNLAIKINGLHFTREEIISNMNVILEKDSYEKRLQLFPLEQKRADILPAGLLIIKELLNRYKISEITASEFALREGIIIDMIKKKAV